MGTETPSPAQSLSSSKYIINNKFVPSHPPSSSSSHHPTMQAWENNNEDQLVFIASIIISMSIKSNLNRNDWNDSMHIFFSPKLSLQGKNMFPNLADSLTYQKDQNFLTVFKKPIVNIYDKISARRERKPVHVQGESKEIQKRTYTTNQKKRNISAEIENELARNYRETITQVQQLSRINPRKGLSTNKLTHTREKPDKEEYYFYIGPGNNAELIETIISRRQKWIQTSSSLFHFRWEQARPKYHSNTIQKQLLNHLPNHEAISDKVGLTRNLRNFCHKNQVQMFKLIPVCFELNFAHPDTCELEIKKFVDFYWHCTEKSLNKYLECQLSLASISQEKGQFSLQSPKKVAKKDSPTKNSKNFRTHRKDTSPVLNPESSKKKEEVKEIHRALLIKLKPYHNFIDMSSLKKDNSFISPVYQDVYGETGLWILKPADMNRGRGIHIFRKIEDLGELLKSQLMKNEKASFIVQKYLQKPMLIHSRKFDIRVYAMVTQNKELYFFKEGYIRTSSMKFDLNCNSQFAHLTNNAIQKHSKAYGQFEEGNILPLHYLFQEMGMNKETFYEDIKNKIKITIRAGYSEMFRLVEKVQGHNLGTSPSTSHLPPSKAKQFQIFGYDFMIDETGRVWIIEVNTNPCIELSCSWLKQIIPRMLDDAFKLTLDRVFPKGRQLKEKSNEFYPISGYRDSDNLWEFLDLKSESQLSQSCPIL